MKTVFDWSSYRDAGVGDAYADIPKNGGDFARAVAVCINSKQCETATRGVMCPSYRVTQDSNLSTGGRVRLLKAALNADSQQNLYEQDDLDASMALCVGCKGCRRECENEVDMAMIKVEYLAQRHARQGIPFRTRLLANFPTRLHKTPALRQLLKLRNRFTWLARLAENLLGISAKASLPVPARQTYLQSRKTDAPASDRPEVVLLIDSFTNNFAPENVLAATEVLEAAGYRVIPACTTDTTEDPDRPLCCGRTFIANGMVEQARAEASRLLSVLQAHVAQGRQIIGLEPACLLAIRDDYRFLKLDMDVTPIANQSFLFEEFIAREITAKRLQLNLKPVDTRGQPILVHGHCHQKAVGAMKSMRKVLKLIPELKFEMIESSCCGMAGSFGIEKEHAEIGRQMAELALLPTIREHEQARILANGFSCQQQILQGSGRPALHIARLLQEAIV
ncbi:MAG: 4Fe-4S dicluster domain-containing protein [Chromatiales bacterium]|jgi:Fe-S oxidoreductase